MNLVEMSFDKFSDSDFHEFVGRTQRRLPTDLLSKAINDNPAIADYRDSIEELRTLLGESTAEASEAQPGWQNPEIYPPIVGLLGAGSTQQVEKHLLNLRLHLGLADMRGAKNLDDGYYRLTQSHGHVYRVRAGQPSRLRKRVYFNVTGFRPVFYLPTDELFNDIVGTNLYPRLNENYNADALIDLSQSSVQLLHQYCPEMWDDLQQVIQCIALTPDLGNPDRWSYNCRISYFGGIFINPFQVNRYGMVESLIHEYYHQRLWQWWAYEGPMDLPDETVTIISPVTGNRRSAQVMIHALIVYISAFHFHSQQLKYDNGNREAQDTGWLMTRTEMLHRSIPSLYSLLRETVLPHGTTGSFLDYLMEQFLSMSNNGRGA
jgi:hypothetical protein